MARPPRFETEDIILNLDPWTQADLPEAATLEFDRLLERLFSIGQRLIESMDGWKNHSVRNDGTTQIVEMPSGEIKKSFGISEYWCGRISRHTMDSVYGERPAPPSLPTGGHEPEAIREETAEGIYERFKAGLMERHSEHESEYIEPMREPTCLQVYRPGLAEIWRMTFQTPPPTAPRTFVELLLTKEVKSGPKGEREFINISLPFDHPDCPPKVGTENNKVRGKYVSVEHVREKTGGKEVEWRMVTSSDAGGNIPRFVTNSTLAKSISGDVPAFTNWLAKKFPLQTGNATATEV